MIPFETDFLLVCFKNEKIFSRNFEKGGSDTFFLKRGVPEPLEPSPGYASVITDASKFRVINNDPTLQREGKLQRFLRGLKNKGDSDNISYDRTFSCRVSTFKGLLTNYSSFASLPYKLGLVRTLVDRVYKINNTWLGFHEGMKKLTDSAEKVFSNLGY